MPCSLRSAISASASLIQDESSAEVSKEACGSQPLPSLIQIKTIYLSPYVFRPCLGCSIEHRRDGHQGHSVNAQHNREQSGCDRASPRGSRCYRRAFLCGKMPSRLGVSSRQGIQPLHARGLSFGWVGSGSLRIGIAVARALLPAMVRVVWLARPAALITRSARPRTC